SQTVNKADTGTVVTSSHNPSVFGEIVTFTATVSATPPGGLTPGGKINFIVDGVTVASDVELSGGQATYSTTPTTPLTVSAIPHTVQAVYSGSGSYNPSNGTLTNGQTVTKSGTSTTLASSNLNAVYGQAIITATVTPVSPGGGTPAGNVVFHISGSADV